MKRYFIAGITAVTLAGAALAFANTLSVTSDTLGSGTDTVDNPGCALVASYTTTWDGGTKEFEVSTVTVNGDDSCAGRKVQAALVGTGVSLWSSGLAVALDANGDYTFTVADGVDAADVTNVYATVNGA